MNVVKVDHVKKVPEENQMFTGRVAMQSIIGTELSGRFTIRQVNFDVGIRTKFHAHSIEQILIATKGKGMVATDKEEIVVVPGDIIFIPAGEKHWHGAAPGSTFSHLYVMSPDTKSEQLEK